MEDLISLAETIQTSSTILADGVPGEDTSGPSSFLQLVVLGSIGSGKSAVLNSLIGHPVLPTAEGGATRFPLVIDIERNKHISGDGVRGKMGTNMNMQSAAEIKKVVQADMKRWLSSRNQEDQQRHLVVQSATAPPVRLIDLPGLESRASDLDNVVLDNAGGDAFILVILPATGLKDSSAARVLKMAQDLDREGSRTVGVITKLDQVGEDKEAVSSVIELVTGQGPSMAQGFPWVAVIGQPTNDKSENVGDYLDGAWKAETQTLGSVFRAFGGKGLESTLGREALVRTLARQMRKRMKERIPKIMSSLEGRSQEVEDELLRFGDTIVSTVEGSRAVALELCRNFDLKFVDHIEGAEGGGAKMVDRFVGALPGRFRALPLDKLFSMDNVKKVTMEADGYQPYLTSPEKGLRLLIKRCLDLAKQPGLQCVDEVHKILMDIIGSASNTAPSLVRFPPLKRELVAIASSNLESYRTEARTMVNSLVDMEQVFIPPGHFIDAAARRYEKMKKEEDFLKKKEMDRLAGQRKSVQDAASAGDDKQPGRLAQVANSLRGKKEPPPPPPPAPPPQELAGFLWKVSSKGGWSKRWFALSDKTARLYYVKKPDEKTPRGVLQLNESVVDDIVSPDEYPVITGTSDPLRGNNAQNTATLQALVFKISNKVPYKNVVKAHQNLILRAENMVEKQQWVLRLRALSKVEKEDESQKEKEAPVSEGEAPVKQEGSGLPTPVGRLSTDGSASTSETSLPTRRIVDPEEELKYMAAEVRFYVEAVLASLSANIPKAIVLTQVQRSKENMLTKLYTSISKLQNDRIAELLEEDPDSKGKREKAKKQQGALASLKRLLSLHEARASAEEANAAPSVKENPVLEDWRIAFQQAGGGRQSNNDEDDEAPPRVSSSSKRGKGGGGGGGGGSSQSRNEQPPSTSSRGSSSVKPNREAPPPPPPSSGNSYTNGISARDASPNSRVPVSAPPPDIPPISQQPMGAPMMRRPNRLPPGVPPGIKF